MSHEVAVEIGQLLAEGLDPIGVALEERDRARDTAVCLEQELAATTKAVAAALEYLDERECGCCPCDDPGCSSPCGICRAVLTLGGEL